MATRDEKRKAALSIAGNIAYIVAFVALVVVGVLVAVDGGVGDSLLAIGGVAVLIGFWLAVIYLLVRFIKWAARR